MARAMKCDVCGSYYDPYNTGFDYGSGVSINAFKFVRETSNDEYHQPTKSLCKECLKRIERATNPKTARIEEKAINYSLNCLDDILRYAKDHPEHETIEYTFKVLDQIVERLNEASI